MDAHLVHVPGLGTLTVGGLAGGDLERLGGEADGALDAEVLGLGALKELGGHLLEGLDLAGGEGDADLVDLLRRMLASSLCSAWYMSRCDRNGRGMGADGEMVEMDGHNVQAPRQSPSRPSGKTS